MGESVTQHPTIIRTSRGLTIGGRRTTLYDVMDYLIGGWTREQIRDILRLSEQEMCDVMAYIRDHRVAVVVEYAQVVQQAEENRQYWEEELRAHFAAKGLELPSREPEAVRARVEAHRERLLQERVRTTSNTDTVGG